MAKITLDVNGKSHTVDADPDMPLLYALRNELALTGQLPGILELAVPLALVASLLLLFIYRLAVKRSMRRRGGKTELAPGKAEEARAAPSVPLDIVTVEDVPAGGQFFPRRGWKLKFNDSHWIPDHSGQRGGSMNVALDEFSHSFDGISNASSDLDVSRTEANKTAPAQRASRDCKHVREF